MQQTSLCSLIMMETPTNLYQLINARTITLLIKTKPMTDKTLFPLKETLFFEVMGGSECYGRGKATKCALPCTKQQIVFRPESSA